MRAPASPTPADAATADDVQVASRAPLAPLRRHVDRLFIVASSAERRDVHLPGTGLVAAFCYQGECVLDGEARAPRAAITGLFDTVRGHAHSADHAVVIVSFTATGAGLLLRQSLDEFSNTTVDLGDALGLSTGVHGLTDELAHATSHEQRLQRVEAFLCERLADARPDPPSAVAVGLIEQHRGLIRIDELARQVGLSQSALERKFRRHVGVSPRKFASLVRLQHVARLQRAGLDLTTIAHEAGYFDQPHFIRDFKRFAGVAPTSFFSLTPSGH